MTLTFYTNPMSRGRIIRWMLEEVGEPYETVVLDYGTTMKGADYLAINPMGKVPAIRHGDAVVTEAAAICAYLADAFPDRGLAPAPGDARRAPYFRWLFFAAGSPSRPRRRRSSAMAASTRRSTISSGRSSPGLTYAATSSPPPTSMSARRSAGG